MSWNYRIYHKTITHKVGDESYTENEWSIRETYYDDENHIMGYTEKACDMSWCDPCLKDGKTMMDRMRKAFDNPVIELDEFDNRISEN